MIKNLLFASLLNSALLFGSFSHAQAIVPIRDSEVIETLAGGSAERREERKLRRSLAEQPNNAALATRLSGKYLARARETGDPRYAGLSIAALHPWQDDASAPGEVLLLQATLDQYLHQFDAAAAKLERLLQRDPKLAQAWLTLATIRRVQGRYDASDRACHALMGLGANVYGPACLAENEALRGNTGAARNTFKRLLAEPRADADTRNWLATSLAELEERAGESAAAQTAWTLALQASATPYTVLSYADFLIFQGRFAEALSVLKNQPRNDGVLLRVVIAAVRAGAPGADAQAGEMRERIAVANLRPGTQTFHGREQAMFALWVDKQPQRALELARENVRSQREPIDLLILAQAARATGEETARLEADTLRRIVGLRDKRIEALL
jgi:tetratricopeptide (TPR) repeat protein